ncbi:MAG: hypothetical protein ABIR24_05155 [Verrucomicrobiota bacterium]
MDNNKSSEEVARDVEQTRNDAKQALRIAGKVWSGENAVGSAWRSTKGTYFRVQDKVLDKAYAADEAVRENIYATLGITLVVGTVLGFFLTNKPQSRKKRKE